MYQSIPVLAALLLPAACMTHPTYPTPPAYPTTYPSTTTTKTTPTSSPTKIPTPDPITDGSCPLANLNPFCQAQGFNVDYYANNLGQYGREGSGVLSNYYIVEGLSPLASSLTNSSYFPQTFDQPGNRIFPNSTEPTFEYYPGWTRVIDGMTLDTNNFTLVYQGFYRAPVTGTFQVCSGADDENDIYFGDGSAFGCLTGQPPSSADPMLRSFLDNFLQAGLCESVELTEGRLYPFRSVMGNWQGQSGLDFAILPPGTTIENRSNDFSGLAFPFECGVFLPPILP